MRDGTSAGPAEESGANPLTEQESPLSTGPWDDIDDFFFIMALAIVSGVVMYILFVTGILPT